MTLTRFACLSTLNTCVDTDGAGRSTWGIYRFTLDFRAFLREIEIRGSLTGD